MKYIVNFFSLLWLTCLFASCNSKHVHFISDPTYRTRVEQDFQQKQIIMHKGNLFAIFDTDLTLYEREALEFLYAYMPLADITDYSGGFHLMNVQAAHRASEEMPWGRMVSEELFRHFVLPVRVNNEPLDSARVVFYEELKPRVQNLSMRNAILEVNHWCHEKAVYQPSDARTSSPLATVRTAYGRCGEESTFLVAALRSVGIPSRIAGTASWHDNRGNHNWCEVWLDGKWYFTEYYPNKLNDSWFLADAGKANPNERMYAIWASSFKPTGECFPLVWDLNIDYVPAINVTQRYIDIYLKERGIKIALATASPYELFVPCLKRLNVYSLFDLFVSTDDVSHGKDDPEIYLEAAKKLGFPPENCAVAEDSHIGIVSAKTAGFFTIGVFDSASEKYAGFVKENSDLFVQSLKEVTALL